MNRFRLPAVLVLLLAPPGCGGTDREPVETAGDDHATVRLIADTRVFEPGGTHTLGVSFDIEPGWYLYWDGMNDTGYPITLELDLPPGFTAGRTRWPAPERHVSPGNILDHVYREQVTLLVPLHVSADAGTGEWATIRATARWVACREACVPGSGETALSLLVADPGSDIAKAAGVPGNAGTERRLDTAKSRLPEPPQAGEVRWHWADGNLVVEADGADYIAFFPLRTSMAPEQLIEDGESRSGTLTLRFAGEPGEAEGVEGVVEVRNGGPTRFYELVAPLPESG